MSNPNRSRAKTAPALAAPANYFTMRFNAASGGPYHLWVRLRAQSDATGNDSVHVQFGDSIDSAGRAVSRIGTTQSAEVVLQNGSGGAKPHAWGWSDNGWGATGPPLYFKSSGTHELRVQQREDGAIVDQLVLSRDTFLTRAPGTRLADAVKLPASSAGSPAPPPPPSTGTRVIWAAHVPDAAVFGSWQPIADATAAGGLALRNRNAGLSKIVPALPHPANYFEATFSANTATAYHVWVRMRADGNATGNDSVHLQFNDSLSPSGAAVARIGTSSSAEFVLQAGSKGAPPHGWGWTENGWDALGPHTFFASGKTHTVRVQQREDGAIVDQIVISPDAYLSSPPGGRRDDTKVLAATVQPTGAPPADPPPDGESDPPPGTPPPGTGTPPAGTGTPPAGTGTPPPGTGTPPPTAPRTWTVVFTPPSDHATVTSYLLEIFAAGADPNKVAARATSSLGRPALDKSGEVSVDRTSFFTGLPAGSYTATVSAVAAGRKSRSAPYSFTR